MNRIRITAAVFICITIAAYPQQIRPDAWLQEYVKARRVPSISSGTLAPDSAVWHAAAGKIDLELQVNATSSSLYRIASVSKFITAVAVLTLVQERKLRLDDDARNYLPYFPAKRWKFTIRQLLNHTSGIRTYRNENEFNSTARFTNIREAVEYLAKDSLLYEPGTGYTYSSLAYNLLAGVIEQASGMPYTEYLRKAVFLPAGMTATRIDEQELIVEGRAKGYYRDSQRLLKNAALADLSIKIPGGGLLSNVADLLRFCRALLNGRLLTPALIDTMRKETVLKNGTKKNYGLGCETGTDKKGRVYFGHGGAGTGFSSYLILYPQQKTAGVYLVNCRDRLLGNPAQELAAALLGDTLQKPKILLADFLLERFADWGIERCLMAADSINNSSQAAFIADVSELRFFGDALLARGNRADAIAAYSEGLKSAPDNRDLLLAAGRAYLADGNKGMALKHLKKARLLYPDDQEVTSLLATLEPPAPKQKVKKSK